jgi:hypothetical protein
MNERMVPSLVRDYYHRCVPEPPRKPLGTLLEQTGEIRLAPERRWMPFTAEQSISATQPQFLWHARCKMAPLATAVVEDAYETGRGRLDAKLWGVFPLARGRGANVDQGELQRYLAELVWCPMALVHNPDLNFRVLAEDCVRVWVQYEDAHVDLMFDGEGLIAGAKTTTRPRGQTVQPWEGRFYDFKKFGGIRAPARGEVWWDTPDGRFLYWRGEVTSLRWAP